MFSLEIPVVSLLGTTPNQPASVLGLSTHPIDDSMLHIECYKVVYWKGLVVVGRRRWPLGESVLEKSS